MVLNKSAKYDAVADQLSPEDLGLTVAQALANKGFAVIHPCVEVDVIQRAREDAVELEDLDRFLRPAELVVDGLLGSEGSARIAELEKPGQEAPVDGDYIQKMDRTMSDIVSLVDPWTAELMGFSAPERSLGLVHESSLPEGDEPELTEVEASKWLSIFTRHRIMVILCLGPKVGELELQPFEEDTDAHAVETSPGDLIMLRPDAMSHKFTSLGRSFLLSCFLLENQRMDRRALPDPMIPVAKQIDEWAMDRMRALKVIEDVVELPPEWKSAMNHYCYTGQRIAVRGVNVRTATTWNYNQFFQASPSGPDLVVEIPLLRWDHTAKYDPDLESWRRMKTCVKHGAFVDGIELFDSRMFMLSPMEAKGMDPNQRFVLECGYEALYGAGYKKGQIMNSIGGVYLGASISDWAFVDKSIDGTTGATGGAVSITSNRFSFCLGMKGPSLTCDTEGSASLCALHLGAEGVLERGCGQINAFSLSGGVSLCMATPFLIQLQAAKLLSREGRSLTFDESATGFVRSDGAAMVCLERLTEEVDGQSVMIEGRPLLSTVAASSMNHNGKGASMHAPNGPVEQELINKVVENAGISLCDVDGIECHCEGSQIGDAVETGALLRALRSEENRDPLILMSVKSYVGHCIEASGILGYIKTVMSSRWGIVPPNVHLRQLNPFCDFHEAGLFPTEATEYKLPSAFVGTGAHGFGGTNVHVLNFGHVDEQRVMLPALPHADREKYVFWPGGGGALEADQRPKDGYYVAGTFTKWTPAAMESETGGIFGFTVTMGENRWEKFQIWLDGDSKRRLHPGMPNATKSTQVFGPDWQSAEGNSWLINGLGSLYVEDETGLPPITNGSSEMLLKTREPSKKEEEGMVVVEVGNADKGKPGDRYRIRIRVAGKYRTVDWEKLDAEVVTAVAVSTIGEYFVFSTWNHCTFQQLTPDPGDVGHYSLEVTLLRDGGDFVMLRNMDWDQVLYPEFPKSSQGDIVYGPNENSLGSSWCLGGTPGDVFRIHLWRSQEAGEDVKKVSWEKLRTEELSEEQRHIADTPRLAVLGSWDGWRMPRCAIWTGDRHQFFVQLGDRSEGFQLLLDWDWSQVVYPSTPGANPMVPHAVCGPDDGFLGFYWVLDGKQGEVYAVDVYRENSSVQRVTWEKVQGSLSKFEARGLVIRPAP